MCMAESVCCKEAIHIPVCSHLSPFPSSLHRAVLVRTPAERGEEEDMEEEEMEEEEMEEG